MDPIEQLAFIVPLVSIGFVLAITSINVFIRVRRKFPATVNCWFCNRNTKVPYDDSNSWDCPHCLQYNGFTEDGDYNRDIPAQRVLKLNRKRFANVSITGQPMGATNGLCEPCNRNQELKMQQLASFEPDDERTFDVEVEAYRRQLDQSYRLCPRCERQLKRTLTRVKQNVLGSKLAEIGAKGINAFDLHTLATNKKNLQTRKRRLTRLFGATLIVLGVINCIQTSREVRFTRNSLNLLFPNQITTVILVSIAAMSMAKGAASSMMNYIVSTTMATKPIIWVSAYFQISNIPINMDQIHDLVREQPNILVSELNAYQWTNIAPILLSVLVVWMNNFRWNSLVMLLFWSIKCSIQSIDPVNRFKPEKESSDYFAVVLNLTQVIVDWSVLVISIQDAFTLSVPQNHSHNSSFHRIYADADELSEDSDLETTLSSTRSHNFTARSRCSPRTPINASINTTRSMSPSVFTPSTLRPNMTSSINALNRSFSDDTYPQEFIAPTRPHPSHGRLNSTLDSSQSSTMTTHSKFQSMQSLNGFYDVPDEFQSGITQLNISGNYKTLPLSSQPSYLGAQTSLNAFAFNCPTLEKQLRYRSKSIIEPSRLQAPSQMADQNNHKASWIAGGYWNQGMSPTKRTSAAHQAENRSRDPPLLFPVISRTSSQSSGFDESRESSVGPTTPATFADTFANTINPSDSVSQCGQPDYQSLADPMPSPGGFSMYSTTNGCPSGNGYGCSTSNGPSYTMGHPQNFNESSTRYCPAPSSFGRASTLFDYPSTSSMHRNHSLIFGASQASRPWAPGPPPIEHGSLLKSWKERTSQLDLRLS